MNVLVLKVSAGEATVIAGNGEFMTVSAKGGMKEGADFEYTPERKTWKRHAIAVAASFLLCVLGFGALGTFTVSSYIDININPGVRLAVNQWGSVISAEAINEDGGVLISEIDSSLLQDPQTCVKQIVGQAWKDGTLKASGHILLTISDNDMQRAQRTEKQIMVSTLETVKEAGLSVDITLQKFSRDSFDAMRKEQEALDDKSKSEVYKASLWNSEKGGLYIEEAEYAGNGVIEVEFSGEVSFTGNESISVEDLSGVRYPAQVKEANGEKLLLQCGGLKEDNIYKITVENIGTEEKTLSSFLYINSLGIESGSQNIQPAIMDNENDETDIEGNENGNTDSGDEDNSGQQGYEDEDNSGTDKDASEGNENEDDNTDQGNTDNGDDEGNGGEDEEDGD